MSDLHVFLSARLGKMHLFTGYGVPSGMKAIAKYMRHLRHQGNGMLEVNFAIELFTILLTDVIFMIEMIKATIRPAKDGHPSPPGGPGSSYSPVISPSSPCLGHPCLRSHHALCRSHMA